MRVTYTASDFREEDIQRIYIRYIRNGRLRRYDVRADNYTIRESDVVEADYTPEQVAEAKRLQGQMFGMVRVK